MIQRMISIRYFDPLSDTPSLYEIRKSFMKESGKDEYHNMFIHWFVTNRIDPTWLKTKPRTDVDEKDALVALGKLVTCKKIPFLHKMGAFKELCEKWFEFIEWSDPCKKRANMNQENENKQG